METLPDRVILVHGTGVAVVADTGEQWWQRGSSVQLTLDQLLAGAARIDEETFHWTGGNTETDRLEAAKKLLVRIKDLEAHGYRYHLVGHSHGGSVIWTSLVLATQVGMQLAHLRSWTTLGTPFLRLEATRMNGLLIAPLLCGCAFLIGGGQLSSTQGLVSAPAIVTQFVTHFNTLWNLGFLQAMLLIPVLLLGVIAIFYAALRGLAKSALAKVQWRVRRAAQRKCWNLYHDRALIVWSASDEAINGLAASVGLQADLTPRWKPAASGRWARLRNWPVQPVQWFYNRFIAAAADEFAWSRICRRLQGNFNTAVYLRSVGSCPLPQTPAWPALPDIVEADLVDEANRHAASTLAAIRGAIALNPTSSGGTTAIAGIASNVTGQELVHTRYYLHPDIQRLIGHHIRRHATVADMATSENGRLAAWYDSVLNAPLVPPSMPGQLAPRPAVLPLVEGLGYAAVMLVAWVAASNLHLAAVRPLTNEYHFEAALADAVRALPAVYPPDAYPAMRTLTAANLHREVIAAADDAFKLEERIRSRIVVAATLRKLGKADEAESIEADALRLTKELQSQSEVRNAVRSLVIYLASQGKMDKDLMLRLGGREVEELRSPLIRELGEAGAVSAALALAPTTTSSNDDLRAAAETVRLTVKAAKPADALKQLQRYPDLRRVMFEPEAVLDTLVANELLNEAEQFALGDIEGRSWRVPDFFKSLVSRGHIEAATAALPRAGDWDSQSGYTWAHVGFVAKALAKAGKQEAAQKLLRQVLRDLEVGRAPWQPAQYLIENAATFREVGVGPDFELKLAEALAACVDSYGGGRDDEVFGRAVESLIKTGDVLAAEAHVRSLPQSPAKAFLSAYVSGELYGTARLAEAEVAFKRAVTGLRSVKGDSERTRIQMALASALARKNEYRLARIEASLTWTSRARLEASTNIVLAALELRRPGLRKLLIDEKLRRQPHKLY